MTPEGEVFLKAGAEILQIYGGIWHELELLKNSTSGVLKIATVFSVGFHDLPPILDGFRESFPDVRLDIRYRRDKEVYADVLENKVDLGVVAYPQASKDLDIAPAWTDRLVVICSPRHDMAGRESIDLGSLKGQRFIAYQPDPPTRKAIEKMLHESDISVEPVMAFDNIETVKRAVEIEGGISIVPAENCLNEVKAGSLHQIDLDTPDACRPVGILRRRGKVSPPAMDALVAMLQRDS